MPETKPIPVRLNGGVITRLDRVAAQMGTNRAALIRFLVQTFTDNFERRGGVAGLPHDWETIMKNLDGRTFGQRPGGMYEQMPTGFLNETPEGTATATEPRKLGTYPPPSRPRRAKK